MNRSPAVPVRPIVLTTLYRNENSDLDRYLVTSYKIDPKGEEFFGSCNVDRNCGPDNTYINRIMMISGDLPGIPLINSRVVYDMSLKKTVYTGILNGYPPTKDYKQVFAAAAARSSESRISLGRLATVPILKQSANNNPLDKDLITILLGADAQEMARKPKKEATKRDDITEGSKAEGTKRAPRKTGNKPQDGETSDGARVETSSSKPREIKRVEIATPEKQTGTPAQSWSDVSAMDNFLSSVVALCFQQALCYYVDAVEMTSIIEDKEIARQGLIAILKENGIDSFNKKAQLSVQSLSNCKTYFIAKDFRIVKAGTVNNDPRGVYAPEIGLGFLLEMNVNRS